MEISAKSGPLDDGIVRSILGLFARVMEVRGDVDSKRQCLLDGLCPLLGADSWFWSLTDETSSGINSAQTEVRVIQSNESTSHEIGPAIWSTLKRNEGELSGICIYRLPGKEEFGVRELQIARIVLESVSWLHADEIESQPSNIRSLYPRHQQVLSLLIAGLARKTIAERLGLSLNTIHGYVREIYQRLGVHSQAELLMSMELRPFEILPPPDQSDAKL